MNLNTLGKASTILLTTDLELKPRDLGLFGQSPSCAMHFCKLLLVIVQQRASLQPLRLCCIIAELKAMIVAGNEGTTFFNLLTDGELCFVIAGKQQNDKLEFSTATASNRPFKLQKKGGLGFILAIMWGILNDHFQDGITEEKFKQAMEELCKQLEKRPHLYRSRQYADEALFFYPTYKKAHENLKEAYKEAFPRGRSGACDPVGVVKLHEVQEKFLDSLDKAKEELAKRESNAGKEKK